MQLPRLAFCFVCAYVVHGAGGAPRMMPLCAPVRDGFPLQVSCGSLMPHGRVVGAVEAAPRRPRITLRLGAGPSYWTHPHANRQVCADLLAPSR
jgi:hypothetical protein